MTDYGSYSLPATSQVYVCGVPIASAVAAQTTSPQIAPEHRFWATPARPMSYQHSDGLVVNLAKPKLINYLAFDLPAFPHHCYLYYQDHFDGQWKEFCTKDKNPIRIYIDGSTPAMIGTAAAFQAKQHPSHYGAGHWLHYDLDLHPVTTSRIKIVVNRAFGTRKGGPKDPYGKDAAYSLGLRNFDFGCRVRERNDVPRAPRDPDILTQRQTFTQTFDLFGSPVELKLRENRASDLLRGCAWKSEPMPVPYAVVNFYVDARDATGSPQVIDRFDVKPMYSGPCLNLYYSDQVPDGDFTASDTPLVFPLLRSAGTCEPVVQPAGVWFQDAVGYLDISNQGVQWDPSRPFWIGLEFRPKWQYPGPSSSHIIFDAGALQLAWDNGQFRLGYGGGALYMQPLAFDCNTRLRAFISYDGERLSFYMPEAGAVASVPTQMEGMSCESLRFGAENGPSTAPVIYTGNYVLNACVVKQEAVSFVAGDQGLRVPEAITRFMDDPGGYLDKPTYAADEDGSTNNALLRYLPRFVCGSANTHGFVGGPGDIYDDVVWTPVMRDYKLREGLLQFHPVRAKFFKFEFTNLAPEPYQTLMPVAREVKCFTAAATQQTTTPQRSTQIAQSATSAGLSANADAAMQVIRYADNPAITAPGTADVLPTEALTARDLGVQGELDAQGGLYRFDSWQAGQIAPCYAETSKHIYQKVTVQHAKKCAYFVGLCGLTMYRVNYEADDDAEQYIDLFDDTRFLQPAPSDALTWHWDGDRIIAGSIVHPVTTTSTRFASRRKVRGVQFATSQSSAVQLVPDPDFVASRLLTYWKSVGDVITMDYSQDFNATLGQAVKVLRSSQIATWDQMRTAYGTWGGIEASADGDLLPVWSTLEGTNEAVGYGGVELRTPVPVSASGRVCAAARVYADHTLVTPLILQLLSPGGEVLAEAEQVVSAGRVVEWTLEHTMVDYTATANTWNDVMGSNPSPTLPTYGDLDHTLWSDLSQMDGPTARQASVRVIQRGAGRDTWYLDSLAIFEDPILWEFSNDDGATWYPALGVRNDPHGVLVFPDSTNPDAGRALRWRVTGYRPGLHVASLAIRPWYAENTFGMPGREPGVSGGPNIQPIDHYPPIEDDPFFRQWTGAIPQDWYFTYRQLLLLDQERAAEEQAVRPDVFANHYAALVKVEVIPPPSPYSDPYEDAYADMYGVLNP